MVNKVILVYFLDCWVRLSSHPQEQLSGTCDFIEFILCTFFCKILERNFFIFFACFAGLCSDFDDELSSLLACDLQKKMVKQILFQVEVFFYHIRIVVNVIFIALKFNFEPKQHGEVFRTTGRCKVVPNEDVPKKSLGNL